MMNMTKPWAPAWIVAAALAAGALAGCDSTYPVDRGVGLPPDAGVERTFSGVTLKTFSAPIAAVGTAALQSLNYMDIALSEVRKHTETWDISATAGKRVVDIHLEAVTPKATLMRVMVDRGDPFVKDGATATEIVLQTDEALGGRAKTARPPQTAERPAAKPHARRGVRAVRDD